MASILALSMLPVVIACGDNIAGDAPAQPASSKARVKFKGTQRIAGDLAQALELSRDELCQELGQYDCFEAHNILLGGVEPYHLGIEEPVPITPVAAPMAVDRIALSACGERVSRDFADIEEAVLFAEVARTDGDRPSDRAMTATVQRLYDRLLARDARPDEIAALLEFYDLTAGHSAALALWAQLVCFSVVTTTEFLFY